MSVGLLNTKTHGTMNKKTLTAIIFTATTVASWLLSPMLLKAYAKLLGTSALFESYPTFGVFVGLIVMGQVLSMVWLWGRSQD